jgi:hypothetical protein
MHWFKKKSVPRATALVLLGTTDQIIQEGYESRSASGHSSMSHQTLDVPIFEDVPTTRKVNCCRRCCTKENLKDQALLIATIVSVALGIIVGIALRDLKCPTGKKT